MLNEKQLREVLEISKGERLEYDESLTWVDMFKEQVKKNPEKTAVSAENGSLTYEELDRKSDILAAALIEGEGVKADEFVAVHMDREKEFFIAVLGIHKAGAAYMPIDQESPPGRIAYIMENSGARLTLTKKNVSKMCRSGKSGEEFVPRCKPDSHAYMIYTSGSTGEPKGVVIPQRALTAFAHSIARLWGVNENSRISLHANFAFDASVEDIFPPLTVGGTVFIIPERMRKDIFEVREFLAENKINGGGYSTQFGQLLGTDDVPLDVDYFVVGGEAMTVVPNARGRIINTYGPTEFTVDATYYVLEKGREYKNIPIGKPFCNSAAYIVDDKLELLPLGETGELCLAGPQLAMGYWRRAELTAEKFTDISLGNGETVKIYRTGDLARWNEEGQLEFFGRIDTQVKLRGFRVELGEIERCATLFASVLQTAAEVRRDTLCLYYTASADVDEDELKAFMAERLADFMVPQIFIRLDTMPETVNGKIDRKALPDPKHITRGEFVAPETEEERVTEEIIRNVLGSEEAVSVIDDFFEMGGDSIKAIRVVSDLRKQGYLISVAEVMRGRTVRGIAKLLHTMEAQGTEQDAQIPDPDFSEEEIKSLYERYEKLGRPIERIYPLTPMQEGMLLEHISHPESFGYRIADIYECSRPLDEKDLRHAIDALARKHETLRSVIIYNGVPAIRQAILDFSLPLSVVDMTGSADPIEDIMKLRTDILKNDFDLQNGPMTKFVYVKTANSGGYLIFVSHHIITDGWSFDVMVKELNALLRGEEISEGTKGLYEHVVRTQLKWGRDEAIEYYKKMLEGYDSNPEIPSWGEVPEEERAKDDQVTFVLSSKDAQGLKNLCRSAGATLSDGFNMVWGLVLATVNRLDDVVFTTIASGRDGYDMDVSDAVGLFLNPVPIRTDFSDHTITARQMLVKMRAQANETKAYDYCPLADIQDALGGIRLYGLNLSFENYMEPDPGEHVLTEYMIHEDHDKGGVGIDSIVQPDGSVYNILIYDPDLFRESEIHRLQQMFVNYVKRIVKTPDHPISKIRHLGKDELAEVLALSKGEELPVDGDKVWLDAFLEQVEKTPKAAAIRDEEGIYTYEELSGLSDSVARYLIDKGVKEDDFVAVRMGRVKEFFAAVIGIFKAGAAYLPIDPEYPEERILYMYSDSKAKQALEKKDIEEIASMYPDPEPVNRSDPSRRAYMIYTSGSTGLPKGVVISQRSLNYFVHSIVDKWKLNADSRIALHDSFSFDGAVEDMFPALTVGGTIFIVHEEIRKDITQMRAYIEKNKINGGNYSTQFGQLLGMNKEPLDVDYYVLGGEAMTQVPNVRGRIYNTYGPTEFTVDATWYEVDKDREYKNIPIGRPLYNCAAYVVDDRLMLLPRGIAGELCLAGPQLSMGYWKRPKLTREKFTSIYTEGHEKVKVYRTGDLVRWNEEGQLEYLGRIDNLVKLRGFRIELGEVERCAAAYPSIRQTAAAVKKETLCLYYSAGDEVDEKSLKEFLEERLADYMVPGFFIRLDEMPISPAGKLNRKALPEPEIETIKRDYVAPGNETEKKLCDAFAAALNLEENSVGIYDDFFELGGNSIRGMRAVLLADIEGLTTADLYRMHTPAQISALIENRAKGPGPEDEQRARTKAVPATTGQISMIDYQFVHVKSVMYNIPSFYHFPAGIDVDRLKEAIKKAAIHHPALCSTLEIDDDGNVVQRCRPESFGEVEVVDVSPKELEEIKNGLIRPFRLFRESLLRVELYRCEGIVYMFLDMHHVISDGASLEILLTDIARAYEGKLLDDDYYYTWLLKEAKAAGSEEYKKAEEYFEEILGDEDWCSIPTPDYDSDEIDLGVEEAEMDLTLDQMTAAEERLEASGNVICITAGILALQEYCHRSDIMVTWIDSNRSDARYDNTVGMLFKSLPVAVHTETFESVEDLIKEVGKQVAGGLSNSICNYMESLPAQRVLDDDMEINYLIGIDDEDPLAPLGGQDEELDVKDEYVATGERVGVYIDERDGKIVTEIAYQKKAYAEESMPRFLSVFKKYLRYLVLEERNS